MVCSGKVLVRNRHWPAGFGLVEILVALAVGAMGFLGAAALTVAGLRASRTALHQQVAATLAADMADRIRANALGLDSYVGTGPGEDAGCTARNGGCAPQVLAADDWLHWLADVAALLPPEASAAIERAGGVDGGGPCTIALQWPEPGHEGLASYRLVFQQ
jgi:type IV pilus assembly protein PilV